MGCGPSAAEKQYRVERDQMITAHRDVMRGLRLAQGDMEALYEIHLHLCGTSAACAAGYVNTAVPLWRAHPYHALTVDMPAIVRT